MSTPLDPLQVCTGCRQNKPDSDFYLFRDKTGLRRRPRCIECMAAQRPTFDASRPRKRSDKATRWTHLTNGLNALSPTDAAYLAGLVDGEGCLRFRVNPNKASHSPLLMIANTNRTVLEWCTAKIGTGTITVTGASHPTYKPVYQMLLAGWRLKPLLPQIRPYMIIKRQHADVITGWFERHPGFTMHATIQLPDDVRSEFIAYSRECFNQLAALNRKGRHAQSVADQR